MIRTLAISDIHGCYDEFTRLLREAEFNPANDRLILLGDYVDRGPRSRDVVELVMELKREHGAVTLRGNHDQMMLDAVLNDSEEHDSRWIRNGARQTLYSYCGDDGFLNALDMDQYEQGKAYIREHYAHHLQFLSELDFYYETDGHIFVHAGINPAVADWKQQQPNDFIWIREPFYGFPTGLAKTVVFGHTPVMHLHESEHAWFCESGDKIGIDGACVYGKRLLCLEINEDHSYGTYSVPLNGGTI